MNNEQMLGHSKGKMLQNLKIALFDREYLKCKYPIPIYPISVFGYSFPGYGAHFQIET